MRKVSVSKTVASQCISSAILCSHDKENTASFSHAWQKHCPYRAKNASALGVEPRTSCSGGKRSIH